MKTFTAFYDPKRSGGMEIMFETFLNFVCTFPIISAIGISLCPVIAWVLVVDCADLEMWEESE